MSKFLWKWPEDLQGAEGCMEGERSCYVCVFPAEPIGHRGVPSLPLPRRCGGASLTDTWGKQASHWGRVTPTATATPAECERGQWAWTLRSISPAWAPLSRPLWPLDGCPLLRRAPRPSIEIIDSVLCDEMRLAGFWWPYKALPSFPTRF